MDLGAEISFTADLRILPAGEERLRRAASRGFPGDDPDLPQRELELNRDGRSLTVWVGPVDYGGPEEELWMLNLKL